MARLAHELLWYNFMDDSDVKFHLKDIGQLTLCNWEALTPGFWSVPTNVPPTAHTVCQSCASLAEPMLDVVSGECHPSMVKILEGFVNKIDQLQQEGHVVEQAFGAQVTPPDERNKSPFAMIEEINAAAVELLKKVDKDEEVDEELEKFRETIKKSKEWIMKELFHTSCCLPYNMGPQ